MNNRYDFVYLFDCKDGNPNGDPDAANSPRIDPQDMHGLVSDVCLKRKIRNFALLARERTAGYDIFVQQGSVLNEAIQKTHTDLGHDVDGKKKNADRKQVQSVTEAKEADSPNQTMGRKNLIPYGLYRCHGFISAHLARETGFNEADLALFWQALTQMFDHDRSASRGTMAPQKLIVFKHQTALGNAPAHKLFERVTVQRKAGVPVARSFADYDFTANKSDLPSGIELIEML
jgi:CRISPR-associated protein Csd2